VDTRFFTTHEVAQLVHVSPSAVLRWIDQGLLKAFRTPGGHRRVDQLALVAFLRFHQMPVPRELEGQPVRLLVIDDEAAFLRSIAVVVRRAHRAVEVELCESPVTGLLKVGLWRPHVVLLDAYMPGMDGFEVCRRIKEDSETSGIAVVAMSGLMSEEMQKAFRDAGAAAVLSKPISAAVLTETMGALGLVRVA